MNSRDSRREKPFREKYSFFIILVLFALIALYAFVSMAIFALPLFLFLMLLGADVIFVGASSMKRAIDANKWPSTYAKLISANAVKRRSHDNVYKWYLEIEYEYSVSGEVHLSNNYNWIGVASSDKTKIESLIDGMQSSGGLNVKYNPHDFSESVINSTLSPIYFLGIMVGLAIMCGGLIGSLDYLGFINVEDYVNS